MKIGNRLKTQIHVRNKKKSFSAAWQLERSSTCFAALRKKAQDSANEMADQIDQLQKVKQRSVETIIVCKKLHKSYF